MVCTYFYFLSKFIDVGADWAIPEEFSETGEISLQLKRLLAGGVAGAISRTSTAPLDRVKVLLQVHGYKHVNSGIVQCMKYFRNSRLPVFYLSILAVLYMLKEGGFWSLWRGNGINVIKIVPESALKFSMYEYFKLQLRKNTDASNASQSLLHKFIAGSLAGVCAQSVIYPLEVCFIYLTNNNIIIINNNNHIVIVIILCNNLLY